MICANIDLLSAGAAVNASCQPLFNAGHNKISTSSTACSIRLSGIRQLSCHHDS